MDIASTSQNLIAAAGRLFDLFNRRLGLDEASVPDGRACDAFAELEAAVAGERPRFGAGARLLVLRPPGALEIPLDALAWRDVVLELAANARAAGANSVCFSAFVNNEHLWLEVADDGHGFPPAVRRRLTDGEPVGRGLKRVHDLLAAAGGGFRLNEPKAGANLLLRVPLARAAASVVGRAASM